MEKTEIKIEQVETRNLLSVRKKVQWKDAGQEMGTMYGNIMAHIGQNKLQIVCTPISLAHAWDEVGGDIECGIYIKEKNEGNTQIRSSKSYGGKVAVITHKGAYENSAESWGELFRHIEDNKLEKHDVPWEEYVTDPQTEKDESKFITKLYQPIK